MSVAEDTSGLIRHMEEMAKAFRKEEELSADVQRQLATLYEDRGAISKAKKIRDEIIRRTKRDRSALGIRATNDVLARKISEGDYDACWREYKKAMKRFDKDASLNWAA